MIASIQYKYYKHITSKLASKISPSNENHCALKKTNDILVPDHRDNINYNNEPFFRV